MLSHPNERTTSEQEHIYDLLKKLRAFRKHSEHVKQSLASVCRYQYFSPNKVIVRQGHKAENLYFIIDGEVSLSRTEIDSYTGDGIKALSNREKLPLRYRFLTGAALAPRLINAHSFLQLIIIAFKGNNCRS